MHRLTIRNSDGSVSQPMVLNWDAVLNRLAAYEDTGVMPEEIEAQKRFGEDGNEMPKSINELAKEIHENAVAHGWYEREPTLPEAIALIHSELSEALEEYRNGMPMIYGCCYIDGAVCEHSKICDREAEFLCKPEGIAVELCDAVIRIFDTLAFYGVNIESVLEGKHEYNKSRPYKHGGKVI